MSLRRGLVALVLLGTAAAAMQGWRPVIDHGGGAALPGAVRPASACLGEARSPREMVMRAGGTILRHLFRHTMLAGLGGSRIEADRARMMRERRCALDHAALAYHMRVATTAIGGTGLRVHVAAAPGEFAPGDRRLSPWGQRFFDAVGRAALVSARRDEQSVMLISGATARAGAVAAVVGRAVARGGGSPGQVFFRGTTGRGIDLVSLPSKADLQTYLARQATSLAVAPPVLRVVAAGGLPASGFGFGGGAVGLGTPIDLGGAAGWSLLGLIGSADAARQLVVPACIDTAPPSGAMPAAGDPAAMPIRAFLPQFYGAPWTARVGASLVAVLDDYAPRDASRPVPPARLRIYRGWYDGRHGPATYSQNSRAMVYRGNAARLYRLYATGPIDCIDIVDRAGAAVARGYIYYRRGSVIYEVATMFRITQ